MAETEKVEDVKKNPVMASERDNLVLDLYFGTAEKTHQRSSWVGDTQYAPYNPDDLWQKSGDYSIYEDMKKDDQINVAMNLKKDLVIGSGWDIVTEKEDDSELADSIFSRLEEDPERALEDDLDDYIDTMYTFGFAVAEKRFSRRPDNTLTFRSLTTRHPQSWLLHTDDFGNISRFEQHQAKGDLDINPNSLMYSTVGNSLVGPYGRSDLRAAYNAWFVKRHIVRFYSIYLEKAASPIPVGRYDKNLPDAKARSLANVLKKFQAKTSITIPKDMEIEFLESKNNAGDTYIKGINLFNMFIGRALFVPDLLGFTGEGSSHGGSQALGREQVEIFLKHIGRRRRTLERMVNRHIIYPMVVHNEGFQDMYPKFKLRPVSEDKATEYAKTFVEAMRGKMYKPSEDEINHFRSLINFPEGEVEFEKAPAPLVPAGSAGSTNPPRPDELNPGQPTPPVEPNNINPDDKKELDKAKELKEFRFKKPPGDFHKKTDFRAIGAQLEASETGLLKELRPIVNDIYDDLFDQMRKKKIVAGEESKPERIRTIKLKKMSQVQKVIKKHFRESWQKHVTIAQSELFKQNFANIVPSETFLQWLESETFDYVGDWSFNITKEAAVEMRNAIRDGRPLSSVTGVLDDTGKEASRVSAERFARTKFTEIANRARLHAFEQAKVVDGVQYSAILDSRTTVVCAGLHGKKFKLAEAPIPPLHFNCRSIVIPILIFEEYTPDTKPNETMQTIVGGKLTEVPIPDRTKSLGDFVKKHGGKGFVDKTGQNK